APLPAVWRRTAGVLFVAGSSISKPGPPPPRGEWRPVVEPGGYVVVVPDRTLDESLGALFVRRADGVPVLVGAHDDDESVRTTPHARLETAVQAGSVLGPLPAGDVAF